MRSDRATLIAAMISIVALTIPLGVAAQHARYKLIDLGTLGDPNSGVPGVFYDIDGGTAGAQVISNDGTVTSLPRRYTARSQLTTEERTSLGAYVEGAKSSREAHTVYEGPRRRGA